MSTLNARGHEVVDPKPFEPAVPFKPRTMSVFDMVRRESMLARLAQSEEIQSEDDAWEDMTDFEDDFDNPNAPSGGAYEVPDEVLDRPERPQAEKKEEAVPALPAHSEKVQENPVDNDS